MPANENQRVAVVGTGAFGTAISMVLVEAGASVVLWGRDPERVSHFDRIRENDLHLPGARLPPELELTSDLEHAVAGATVVFSAAPTQVAREVITRAAPHVADEAPLISLSKGVERGTLLRVSQVLEEVVPQAQILALSGPSHAEEIASRQPTTVVVAGRELQVAARVQSLLATPTFRVYTNLDIVGVELCGATKNVIAIAAGICDGLSFGDNTKAALLTRGLAEIERLGVAMGAHADTFSGLAGVGDLITTCYSRHGRNRALGEALGRGESLEDYLSRSVSVAEGASSVEAIQELARRHAVEMPICEEVGRIMREGKDVRAAVHDLMTRAMKSE